MGTDRAVKFPQLRTHRGMTMIDEHDAVMEILYGQKLGQNNNAGSAEFGATYCSQR